MNDTAIKEINKILTQINPMIGMIDLTARGLLAIFRKNGRDSDAEQFEAELDKYRNEIKNLESSIAEFKSKFGA